MNNTLEKTLPNNLEAERALLGAILIDCAMPSDARVEDFYLDAHRRILETMRQMDERNEPIELVSLKNTLQMKNQLELVGGTAYLAALTDGLPRIDLAPQYLRIIREKASLRRLINMGNEVMTRAYSSEEHPGEIISSAMEGIDHATMIIDEDAGLRPIGDFVSPVYEELEMRSNKKTSDAWATGFTDLDRMMSGGIRKQNLAVIAGRPGHGKAQPLDAKILTGSGYVNMGDVNLGMSIIGSNGHKTKVIGIYPQGEMDIFRLTFSDGTVTECSDDHLWFTQTHNEQRKGIKGSVKKLSEIRQSLRRADGGPNHYIPLVKPVVFDMGNVLILRPYLMGILLGDGGLTGSNVKFSKPESDIQQRLLDELPEEDEGNFSNAMEIRIARKIRKKGEGSQTAKALDWYRLRGITSRDKFIPDDYLRASVSDRILLLQGLCDTDGHVIKEGTTVEYSTSSEKMAGDVQFLARSLGGYVRVADRIPKYQGGEGSRNYRVHITFANGIVPVSSKKHLKRWKGNSRTRKSILDIGYGGKKYCQCVKVDAEDSLYVTDDFIVTHNTAFLTSMLLNMAKRGINCAFFSLEMGVMEIVERMLCVLSRVDGGKMRTGFLSREDWAAISRAAGELSSYPIYIDDTPALSVADLRSRIRRVRPKHRSGVGTGEIEIVGVDYLQLMSPPDRLKRSTDDNAVTSAISKGLDNLAKVMNVGMLAVSQLSRASEKRTDRRPQLSDLRNSGQIEQDADIVMFVYRQEMGSPTEENTGMAEILLAKQRNGPIADIKLAFEKQCTAFHNLYSE